MTELSDAELERIWDKACDNGQTVRQCLRSIIAAATYAIEAPLRAEIERLRSIVQQYIDDFPLASFRRACRESFGLNLDEISTLVQNRDERAEKAEAALAAERAERAEPVAWTGKGCGMIEDDVKTNMLSHAGHGGEFEIAARTAAAHDIPLYAHPPAPNCPPGWRCVPEEPTDAMLNAMDDEHEAAVAYKAALAKAPKSEKP